MAKTLLLIVVSLLLLVLAHFQANGLSLVGTNFQRHEAPSYHVKRSLCNTYGGCGNKRSLMPSNNDGAFEKARLDQLQQVENGNMIKKDNDASLIDEILSDLVEYMQNNEKYKQGKYVLVVPKHPFYDSGNSPVMGLLANNHISSMDAGTSDLQELQILKRND